MAQPDLALRTTRNGLFSHYVVAGSKNPLPLGMGSVNYSYRGNKAYNIRDTGNRGGAKVGLYRECDTKRHYK